MESTCVLNMDIVPLPKTPTRVLNSRAADDAKDVSNDKEPNVRSPVERLREKLPEVDRLFTVHKKIGEGTFSNVFVATSKSFSEKKRFAIKHLTPTSHPLRIIQEMKCLKDIGGQDNVVGLEVCFRNRDAVAFVMPYFPHDPFSKYVNEMSPNEIQNYMKNLLVALQRVHSFNIIHRDVKPSNFLYNRKEQRFLLVDFGLSHHVDCIQTANDATVIIKTDRKRALDPLEKDIPMESKRPVLHSLPNNVLDKKSDRLGTKSSTKKKSPLFKENSPVSKNAAIARNIGLVKRNLQFGNLTAETKKDVVFPMLRGGFNQSLVSDSAGFAFSKVGSSFFRIQNSQIKSQFSIGAGSSMKGGSMFRKPLVKSHQHLPKECGCDSKARICNGCITRKAMHAPRAGTPGYRSPEVLLKYPHQTTAVDIWSAGVIMLSILSGSYPFFRAPDDISALMEMITVFGTDELRNTAKLLGRNLICNEMRTPLCLTKLCERLRRRSATRIDDCGQQYASCPSCLQKILPAEGCLCADAKSGAPADQLPDKFRCQVFPDEAYDLLTKLLTVNPDKRCTAKDALAHPFFRMDLNVSY